MAVVNSRPARLALAVLALAALVVLLAQLTALRGQDTDLYPRWYGLRQLLVHGRNPYGDDVSREIANQIWFFDGHVSRPEDGSATPLESIYGFLYPLPGALLLAPLALLPYPAAFSAWLLLVLVMLPVATWLVVDAKCEVRSPMSEVAGSATGHRFGGGPCRLRRLLAVPLALFFLPTWATLMLGQPAPAVAFLTALSIWLWGHEDGTSPRVEQGVRNDGLRCHELTQRSVGPRRTCLAPLGTTEQAQPALAGSLGAGAAFAAAFWVKPHLLALLAPFWLGCHLLRWRRGEQHSAHFLVGAGGASMLLVGASFALLPTWLGDFVRAARAYVAVGPGGSAVFVVAQLGLPEPLAWWAAALLTFVVLAWVACAWRQALAEGGELGAIWRTLIATALVVPPAWETNAVLLLLPLAAALAGLPSRRAALLYTGASAALTVALLPPYFVLGWQRGTMVIAAYLSLLAAARLSGRRAMWPLGRARNAAAAGEIQAKTAGKDLLHAPQVTARAHTVS